MLQRLLNWLADTGYFVGGMFYWNLRKSAYVWRERRGRCPCQNESDDSIPGHVRCDAVLDWHNPARFQKICPLLVASPDGWRCSVHASAVRPFWGRVFSWLALSLLGLYLAGTLAVFVGLRAVGRAPVGWLQVAWPGMWHEIKPVQSAYLFRQAIDSFGQGRLPEAYLALTTARQLDLSNYDAALMLAQISMFQRSYLFSDDLFMALWREHPTRQLRTAVTYHDTLLSLDRMGRLGEFAVTMAATDPAHAVVWIRSALLAVRSMQAGEATGFGTKQAGAILALAPHAQLLLRAELDLQAGEKTRALAALHKPFAGPFNPFHTQYQIERLAGLGALNEAQFLLDQKGPLMGDFEHLLVQTSFFAIADDFTMTHASFRALLKLPLTEQRVERLAALLIAHPDVTLYRELHTRVQREAQLEATVGGPTMWITGIVCAAEAEAAFWQTHGRQPALGNYPVIGKLDFSSRDLLAPDSVCNLLNVVSLPRDVILALLWRVSPAPPTPPLGGPKS